MKAKAPINQHILKLLPGEFDEVYTTSFTFEKGKTEKYYFPNEEGYIPSTEVGFDYGRYSIQRKLTVGVTEAETNSLWVLFLGIKIKPS